jgi:eukaryotic-like serine/threonine-protein kinase
MRQDQDSSLATPNDDDQATLRRLRHLNTPTAPAPAGSAETAGQPEGNVESLAALPPRDRQRYKFLEQYAQGGLGRIWRVRDLELGRELALKELLIPSPAAEARFTREALATARLEHPAIVPVHDAGRTEDGELFYTMKLVSGSTLWDVIASAPGLQARLALLPRVLAVAEAVAYAHSKGVLHRDLKPQNILVGDFGETVVIDWGLAKALGATEEQEIRTASSALGETHQLTQMGAVMGTPAYMAPEQAAGMPVDERADVYALGAILYCVVTGRAPFSAMAGQEVLAAVRAGPPPEVLALAPDAPEDLVSVIQRAMERSASNRFASARDFADELNRFLSHERVASHRYSLSARVGRLLQRHREAALAAMVAMVLLAIGTVVAGLRESGLRRDAEKSTLTLLEQQGRSELASGHPLKAAVYLAEALQNQPTNLTLRYLLSQALRPVASKRADLSGHTKDVVSVAYSNNGAYLVTGSTDATVRLWDAHTGAFLRLMGQHTKGLDTVQFSPDSRKVASGAIDNKVRVFDVETGETLLTFDDGAYRVAFTPDGKRLVCGSQNGEVRVRDALTGELLNTMKQHTDRVSALKFSPEGDELYVGSLDKTVSVWNLSNYERVRLITDHEAEVSSIAVSKDGAWVAIAESDAVIHVRERKTWEKSHTVRTPAGARWPNVAFTQNDQVLLARTQDATVRAYHTSSGQILAVVDVRPEGKLFESALHPQEDELAVIGLSGNVAIWSLRGVFDFKILSLGPTYRKHVYPSIFVPEKQLAATPVEDGSLFFWNVKTAELVKQIDAGPVPFALGAGHGGNRLFLTNFKRPPRSAATFDLNTFERLSTFDHPGLIPDVAASFDGTRFATACYDGKVRLVDADTLAPIAQFTVDPARLSAVTFSPDGRELVTSNEFGKVYFLDAATGQVNRTIDAHSTWVQDLEFSHDGRRLATAGRQDHQVRIWDVKTGQRLFNFAQHRNNVMDISWSQDDRLFATAALDHRVHLFDATNGQLLRTFDGPGYTAQLSADGKTLLTTGYNGYAVIWDIEPDLRPVETLLSEVATRSPWRLVDGELGLKGSGL